MKGIDPAWPKPYALDQHQEKGMSLANLPNRARWYRASGCGHWQPSGRALLAMKQLPNRPHAAGKA